MPFGSEKLEWFGYRRLKTSEDMITRFGRIYERDGRTDRQTLHDGIGRACVASRGKKQRLDLEIFEASLQLLYVSVFIILDNRFRRY